MRRRTRSIIGLGAALVCTVAFATSALAAKPVQQTGTEAFTTDVYVIGGSGLLIHVDPRSTPPNSQLFNFAGTPLGMTLAQFETAASTSEMHVSGAGGRHPRTHVRIALQGLIPGGVYSVFYTTFGPNSNSPVCPGIDPTIALTSRRSGGAHDPASFVADARGAAIVKGSVGGNLLTAQEVSFDVIYHFDGKTYGAVPNYGESVGCRDSFGEDAMRQLLIVFQHS